MWLQDKTRQLLECKAQLTEAQQASIAANRNAAELELACAKLDEVSSTFTTLIHIVKCAVVLRSVIGV